MLDEYVPAAGPHVHVIHYSSAIARDCPSGFPPISAVVVENVQTGVQRTFSAFQRSQLSGVPIPDFVARHHEFEGPTLAEFYAFVAERPDAVWVHFGMRGTVFGFDVIEARARLAGVTPQDIPFGNRFDLSYYLKRTHGDDYVPHPRLWHAITVNLGNVPNLLDDSGAADAWRDGRYAAVVWSLASKVGAIANLYRRVLLGTFVTRPAPPPLANARPEWVPRLLNKQAAAIVEALWGCEAVPIETVKEKVWGKSDVNDETFNSALKRANDRLAEVPATEVAVGYTIERAGKGKLRLVAEPRPVQSGAVMHQKRT
jgi:hypothetical protein